MVGSTAPADTDENVLLRVFRRVTQPPLLTGLAVVLFVGTALIAAQYLATRQDVAVLGDQVGTGDFLAFYTGAKQISDGHGAALYDFEAQQAVQRELVGPSLTGFQGYLNPPLLAVALSTVVPFGYVPAFYAFSAMSVLGLVGAAVALRPALPRVMGTPQDAVTAALLVGTFAPVARTTVGGQNTALTLALLTCVYAGLARRHDALAGVALGLLTYKPQYAVVIGLFLLARGAWVAVGTAAGVGLLHYLLGALVGGPRWPLALLAGMRAYGPLEVVSNGGTHISWVRFADFALPAPLGGVIGALGAVAALAIAARSMRIPVDDARFPAVFGTWVVATMLASPHLQYYDYGVLALPAVLGLEHAARNGPIALPVRALVAFAWLAYPAYAWGPALGVQPLTLVLAAFLAWLAGASQATSK